MKRDWQGSESINVKRKLYGNISTARKWHDHKCDQDVSPADSGGKEWSDRSDEFIRLWYFSKCTLLFVWGQMLMFRWRWYACSLVWNERVWHNDAIWAIATFRDSCIWWNLLDNWLIWSDWFIHGWNSWLIVDKLIWLLISFVIALTLWHQYGFRLLDDRARICASSGGHWVDHLLSGAYIVTNGRYPCWSRLM